MCGCPVVCVCVWGGGGVRVGRDPWEGRASKENC